MSDFASASPEAEARLQQARDKMRDPGRRGEGYSELYNSACELEVLGKARPDDARVHYLLGKAYFYLQNHDVLAIKSLAHAARLAPKNAEYAFMHGVALRFSRRPEAAAALRRAVKLGPRQARYRVELAESTYSAEDYATALKQLKAALKLDPKHARALFLSGQIKAGQGRQAEAVSLWERAAQETSSVAANYRLGEHYQKTGERGKAVRHLEAVIRAYPRAWRARIRLIQLYQALGRKKQRDKHRKGLFHYFYNGHDWWLNDRKSYVCDRFTVGGRLVEAREYFITNHRQPRYLSFAIPGAVEERDRLTLETDGKGHFTLKLHPAGGVLRTLVTYRRRPSYDALQATARAELGKRLGPAAPRPVEAP